MWTLGLGSYSQTVPWCTNIWQTDIIIPNLRFSTWTYFQGICIKLTYLLTLDYVLSLDNMSEMCFCHWVHGNLFMQDICRCYYYCIVIFNFCTICVLLASSSGFIDKDIVVSPQPCSYFFTLTVLDFYRKLVSLSLSQQVSSTVALFFFPQQK